MRKALSRNPNMLRTMIGMGLVLILVLSYAVYSNTMDSEYYGYETTNTQTVYNLEQSEDGLASWYVSTSSAATWINVSVVNAPSDSVLTVTSANSQWYHSILLGQEGDAAFNCKEFDEVSESCSLTYSHTIDIEGGDANLIGRSSLVLPINGIGFLHADNQSNAEADALELIEDERTLTTWMVELTYEGEVVSDAGIEVSFSLVEHELVNVYEFQLDPLQETAYGIATLVGCFGLLITVPMIAYYAGVAKARLDEEARADDPAPDQ